MNKLKDNKSGFAIIVIPIALAIVSLIGGGVIASNNFDKTDRDFVRSEDIFNIQTKLNEYHQVNNSYPVQTSNSICGFEVLESAIHNLPHDPLEVKGQSYCYWSDGKTVYTLRYFNDSKQEIVVFSN